MSAAEYDQTLLLVDEDVDFLKWAAKHLEAPTLRILCCDSSDKAVQVIEKTDVDVMISSMTVKSLSGVELLKRARATRKELLVVLTTAFPTNDEIIEVTQLGAHDIIRKEALTFDLRAVAEDALSTVEDRRNVTDAVRVKSNGTPRQIAGTRIIGQSKPFQEIFKVVGKVARTDAPVLVMGESGTGKELISTAVHTYSHRRKGEFVAINCGAIPENLLESELFGHEKGSFTGAVQRRIGRFEQCDGGTLFLDEIGEMAPQVQVRLLRILQTGEFSRVGGNETLKCDTRIVAATNKNLAEEVEKGTFREDLFYRLNVVEIHLPPLRERKEDIQPLAEFFLEKIASKSGMVTCQLSPEAAEALRAHSWPGNVRELENTMTRACALATSHVLLPADIPLTNRRKVTKLNERLFDQLLSLASTNNQPVIDWVAKEIAEQALSRSEGEISEAALLLKHSVQDLRTILRTEQVKELVAK